MYQVLTGFIGVLIAVMVTFNGALASQTSSMFSILVIHIVGLLAVGTIVLIKKENISIQGKMPVYIFLAGMLGVLLTYLNNACIAALGVSLTLALGLVGQAVLSCVIDHFGLFGMKVYRFGGKKLIGFALILVGVTVMVLY
ncbi:MAG: DMT family transporter [Clostridia bacterium]|nr:DMT family transporter [Clostridia bacterium]